jgi:PhnB protein
MTMTKTETLPTQAPVKGGAVAYIQVDGAMKAAEFYRRAFGAAKIAAYPVDEKGRTMHIHLHINDGSVMLGDFYPEHGCAPEKPQGFSLVLQVEDIEAWWNRAVDAGAKIVMPLADMFWGDRYGMLRDPFGVRWGLNQPKQRS